MEAVRLRIADKYFFDNAELLLPSILYSPVPQAGRLPDRAHDVCRFEFLSAFEILTVDFSPQFRYAVLALSVSFLHC